MSPQSIFGGDLVNIIGIDVSRGHGQATLINDDFEKIQFNFKHNRSGFKQLSTYLTKETIVIFETTGVYSVQLARYLRENKTKFYELNPLEAKMRMATLRRNKTDVNDSLKLALLSLTQLDEVKRSRRRYFNPEYEPLRILALRYQELIRQRTWEINHLHSALELSFPELNDIFPCIRSVTALQVVRLYCHPDFLNGLTLKQMTDNVYQPISKHIKRTVVAGYCSQVWLAAKDSYPAIKADSIKIPIIAAYCDQITAANERIALVKKQLIRLATSLPEFKLICSIPGTGQLNTALLLGFTGNLKRFDNYKQLDAYLGIDLNRYQSGQYQKHDRINRRGSSAGRGVEVEMIISMLRNKARIQNHLVDYYYKLKEPPYSKKNLVALVACANHLNRTIMNLVYTNQIYDYQKASH